VSKTTADYTEVGFITGKWHVFLGAMRANTEKHKEIPHFLELGMGVAYRVAWSTAASN
jgi:hypothetical protein